MSVARRPRREQKKIRNLREAYRFQERMDELREAGMKPGKAEETVAEENGIDVYTLRQRLYRALKIASAV